jgi:Zn-dependent protease
MNANIKLGKIWGVPIGLHFSWFLIFGLLTWSLASGYFPGEYPSLSIPAYWLLAMVTSVLFFGSVLAHELGHVYLALRNAIPVKGITLFIFGGVAQIAEEPCSPGAEFRIAIAGPLVSLSLAGAFGGLFLLDQAIPLLAAPSVWLLRINFILAVFNMIPGYPLDGGRVLRALIWWLTKDISRATQIASFSGQLVAFGFISYGIFSLLNGNILNGLWLAFIGWFLQNAAASSYAQTHFQQALQGITVRQVMTDDCARVAGLTPVSQLVDEQILKGGQRCFLVSENGDPRGLLTLRDISQVPQRKWPFLRTEQIMIPLESTVQVTPTTELREALQSMDQTDLAQLPVVENGKYVGLLTRERVLHYLRTRAELGL